MFPSYVRYDANKEITLQTNISTTRLCNPIFRFLKRQEKLTKKI